MKLINQKILYNKVLSQVISFCQKYLFVGNNFGDIFVISTKDITTSNEDEYNKSVKQTAVEPIQIFNVGELPVNSLSFHRNFLIVGTIGTISGYLWDEQRNQITKKMWEIKIPSTPEVVDTSDVNYLLVDVENDHLYAGCGDSNIYLINLDNGKIYREFKGHKDYIHCLAKWDNTLYSASEDGSIMFWDIRNQEAVGKLEPHKVEDLIRPEYGKWQGTVSVTNDWLLCGGGPRASLWHPRSMQCANILPYPGKIHCSEFLDDVMIIAGEYQFVHQYSFNGEKVAEIPTSGAAIYSIVWQNEPHKFMSLAGSSNLLDICTSFNYRDMMVKLYRADK